MGERRPKDGEDKVIFLITLISKRNFGDFPLLINVDLFFFGFSKG